MRAQAHCTIFAPPLPSFFTPNPLFQWVRQAHWLGGRAFWLVSPPPRCKEADHYRADSNHCPETQSTSYKAPRQRPAQIARVQTHTSISTSSKHHSTTARFHLTFLLLGLLLVYLSTSYTFLHIIRIVTNIICLK